MKTEKPLKPDDEARKQEIYSMLTRAYLWLFRTAKPGGHWGEVRSTALAGLCLGYVMPQNSRWVRGVQSWLRRQQTSMGEGKASWGEELWDTSMAVIALLRLGTSPQDPMIQSALQWQLNLYDQNGHRNWHYEPWETSWTVLSLLEAAPKGTFRGEAYQATQWLVGLQDVSGRIVAPHYTAYFLQIYSKLKERGELRHDHAFGQAKNRALDYLMSSIDPNRLWTGEAWSNGQILWSLLAAAELDEFGPDVVRPIAQWFERTQHEEGCWGHDAEDTASSILGLYQLVRRLEAETEQNSTKLDQLLYCTLSKNVGKPPFVGGRWHWERDDDGTVRIAVNILPRDGKIAGAVVLAVSTISLVITFWEQLKGLFRGLLGVFG
jgi:hypothetical protein